MVRARGYIVVRVHLACRERAVRDPLRRGDMAGSQANRTRRAGPAVGLAVLFLALGATARAQVPGLSGPAPPGDARAQDPSPPLPPAGMPAASFADIVDPVDPPEAMPGPTTAPRALVQPRPGAAPTAARVETGDLRHDHRVGLRPARSGLLAAAAVLDALQRRLERGLGAIAQRFGRRAAARLDQCRRRATCTGAGSSRSPRGSTTPRRATPTSVPTRS